MSAPTSAAAPSPGTRGLLFFSIAIAIGILALLAWTLSRRSAPPLAAGQAPLFELTSFDGQSYRLSDLRKPVILNFWASWCQPCREEAPFLQQAWEAHRGEGLLILGVDYVDTEPEARKYLSEFKITYPAGPDLGTRISQGYRISGVPETYFLTRDGKLLEGVDADGHVNANWIGPIPDRALQDRVRLLLSH